MEGEEKETKEKAWANKDWSKNWGKKENDEDKKNRDETKTLDVMDFFFYATVYVPFSSICPSSFVFS